MVMYRSSTMFNNHPANQASAPQQQLTEILDRMGEASAKAQRLPQVITNTSKFFTSDNKIFIRAACNQVVGFIKVGKRNLFYRCAGGQIKEIKPLCVLDFYVHESMQRGGHGRALFEMMLQTENTSAEKLGYDRPSEKLIQFLAKHYGLKRFVP